MGSRPRGGYIGYVPQPAAAGLVSAAGGIWTLREAEALRRLGTWPIMDPFRDSVIFQSSFDGADGATTWADVSVNNRTPTITPTGSAFLTTSVRKYGSAALASTRAVTTSSTSSAQQGGVQYGSGLDFDIWNADATVECWFYLNQRSSYAGIICRDDPARRGWSFIINYDANNGVTFALTATVFTTTGNAFAIFDSVQFPLATWAHIAMVRDGTTLRLYRDGVQRASASMASITPATANGPLTIGCLFQNGIYPAGGYIDDARITTACRYPGGTTFTPPSAFV